MAQQASGGAPDGPDSGGGWGRAPERPTGWQPVPVESGPAPGIAYADLTLRVVAYFIDALILAVGFVVVAVVLGAILLTSLFFTGSFGIAIVGVGVLIVANIAASAVYFIYTWTHFRASPGQRVLGLETLRAADGGTLTQDEAIRRYVFLFGPQAVASVLSLNGIFAMAAGLAGLGQLLSLLALAYAIYLLYTTAMDSRRQGFHDKQVGTVVVKRVAA